MTSREAELRRVIDEIRTFAEKRADLDWEEHGDDFRKIVEMCDQAPDAKKPPDP